MNKFEKMARDHFNEPVLLHTEVGRCIGYAEDDRDCYLIIKKRDGNIYWHTYVGGYIWLDPLKGQDAVRGPSGEYWDDFVRVDNNLSFRCPKEKEFILKIEKNDD